MSHNITVRGGKTVRLPTAGKYCHRDIVVDAPLKLQEKQVSFLANGTTVLPDSDYDGLKKVYIHPISSEYVKPLGTLAVIENGTHDVREYAFVNVDVAGAGFGDEIDGMLDGSITEIDSDVATVLPYACRGRSSLVRVNLPNATRLETYSFNSCTSLTEVNAPVAITIGTYAFGSCSALETIKLQTANAISTYTFTGCYALKTADFDAVRSIAASAFYNCSRLEELILRYDGVVTLAAVSAFVNCYRLKGTVNSTYNPDGKKGYVYIPRAYLLQYPAANNWGSLDFQYRALEDYTVDGTIYGDLDPLKTGAGAGTNPVNPNPGGGSGEIM